MFKVMKWLFGGPRRWAATRRAKRATARVEALRRLEERLERRRRYFS